jgi:hypothetical protein
MRHSLKIYEFLFQKRRERKPPELWDIAEPISLDEIKAELANLTRTQFAEKFDPRVIVPEELSLDQLWKIFESLEEVDDCQIIF